MATKKNEPLKCAHCKQDVLTSEEGGLIVTVEHTENNSIDDVFVCCSESCFEFLKEIRVGEKEIINAEYIDILKNPILYLQYSMDFMEQLRQGKSIDERAFEEMKTILIRCYQYIVRDITEEEREDAIKYNRERYGF